MESGGLGLITQNFMSWYVMILPSGSTLFALEFLGYTLLPATVEHALRMQLFVHVSCYTLTAKFPC